MSDVSSDGGGAVVLPFVPRARVPLMLNVSERIQMMEWEDAARASGVTRVCLYGPETSDGSGLGSFLLIYENSEVWAAWGIAVRPASFEVWRPSSGVTVGWYRSFREALRAIRDV